MSTCKRCGFRIDSPEDAISMFAVFELAARHLRASDPAAYNKLVDAAIEDLRNAAERTCGACAARRVA